MNESDRKVIEKLVDNAIDQLREHCDSVHIFVTMPTSDGNPHTAAAEKGAGNFYARLGQIEEWLCIQKQYQRNWAIRKDAGIE